MTTPSDRTQAKADRYLVGHHVAVEAADWSAGVVSALVQGSRPTPYRVVHTRSLGWTCDCPASATCAHILAVAAVFPDPVATEPSAGERAGSAERGLRTLARVGAWEDQSW